MMASKNVDRKALAAAVTLALGCTGRTLPMLANARLRCLPDGALEVETTDLAARLALSVPGAEQVGTEWAVLVSPKALLAALRMAGAAERVTLGVDAEESPEGLTVYLGEGTQAWLPTLPPEPWPAPPPETATISRRYGAGRLQAALQAVACAAADEDTRSALHAVHVRLAAETPVLTATATDGRRMHQAWIESVDLPASGAEGAEALLRVEDFARLAQFLAAVAAGDDGDLVLSAGETTVRLAGRFGGMQQVLALRQMDADRGFPDVGRVLPDPAWPVLRATVDGAMAAALVTSLRRLEATDGRSPATVRLRVDWEGGLLWLDSGDLAGDQAHAKTVMACQAELSDTEATGLAEVTLDARFLDEALAGAAAAGVSPVIGLRGPGRPATFERAGALCVVMPLTV